MGTHTFGIAGLYVRTTGLLLFTETARRDQRLDTKRKSHRASKSAACSQPQDVRCARCPAYNSGNGKLREAGNKLNGLANHRAPAHEQPKADVNTEFRFRPLGSGYPWLGASSPVLFLLNRK